MRHLRDHSHLAMLSIRPLTSQIRRQPLSALACETHIVEPASRGIRPRAIRLPDEMDRVKDVQEETNLAFELGRVNGGQVEHAATIAYELRDAQLIQGRLFLSKGLVKLVYDPRRVVRPHAIDRELDSAAFTSSSVSDRYFGHALVDRSCTTLMAKGFAPVFHPQWRGQSASPHLEWYERLWDVHCPMLESAVIQRAWVFQDFGMNAHRAGRMQLMRSLVHAKAVAQPAPMAMILRGKDGARRHLRNERELANMLAARGATIVDPMQEAPDEIVQKLSGVPLVIGVEGSALAHGLMGVANQGGMLLIQPPYRFNNLYKDYSDALQLSYGFVVAEGGHDTFELDGNRLLRAIDLMWSTINSGQLAGQM